MSAITGEAFRAALRRLGLAAERAKRADAEIAAHRASQRARERFGAAYRALRMTPPYADRVRLAAIASGWAIRAYGSNDVRAHKRGRLDALRNPPTADLLGILLAAWRAQRAMPPYARRLP